MLSMDTGPKRQSRLAILDEAFTGDRAGDALSFFNATFLSGSKSASPGVSGRLVDDGGLLLGVPTSDPGPGECCKLCLDSKGGKVHLVVL